MSYKVHQTMAVPPEDWYVVEGTHVPLVPPALFQRAQELAQRETRRAPGQRTLHLGLPASCGARTAANP